MRIKALIIRIFRQLLRDKRTLALLLVAPLLVLTLMHFIFNGDTVTPRLGTVGLNQTVVTALEKADGIDLVSCDNSDRDTILTKNLDGVLEQEGTNITLTLQNNDPSVASMLKMKVTQGISAGMSAIQPGAGASPLKITTDYIYGSADTTVFTTISPILIGFFVFFFVFLISGIGLLRERTTGTLERLMSTPIKRYEVVAGYLLGYGFFALIQTLIIIFFSVQVLGISPVGSIWNVILINFISALSALSLGILLSTFASSEFQMIQFIPIVIIPQVFFSGIFPMEGMADWLRVLGKIMPMYYAADALKGVIYMGYGFSDIAYDLLILTVFAAIFIILNIFALKKYRRL